MADTGAPWNIPYVEPTDLVREYPAADEAQANAIAAGLNAAGNAGIGSNVVQTVKTNVFTHASRTFTDIPGLTATITPSSETSRVLVIVSIAFSGDGVNTGAQIRLMRGSTPLYIGDEDGITIRVSAAHQSTNDSQPSQSFTFLDSPASTAALAYNVEVARNASGGIAIVNRTPNAANDDAMSRQASGITLIEVAA